MTIISQITKDISEETNRDNKSPEVASAMHSLRNCKELSEAFAYTTDACRGGRTHQRRSYGERWQVLSSGHIRNGLSQGHKVCSCNTLRLVKNQRSLWVFSGHRVLCLYWWKWHRLHINLYIVRGHRQKGRPDDLYVQFFTWCIMYIAAIYNWTLTTNRTRRYHANLWSTRYNK